MLDHLNDPEFCAIFSHVNEISITMLQLWRMHQHGLRETLLQKIIRMSPQEQNFLLSFMLILETKLGPHLMDYLSKIRSIPELKQSIALVRSIPDYVEYPAPPFPATSWLTPISNSLDLYLEGKEMRHCVGGNWKRPISGKDYFYHAVFQEHGYTLHIANDHGSIWSVRELKAKCNQPPPCSLTYRIHKWLNDHQPNLV